MVAAMEPADVVPIGYKFAPTDEQLVVDYLGNKVAGKPLPSQAVAEADVYGTEPWNLLGSDRQEAYFFSERKHKSKRITGSRVDRKAGNGYWNLYRKEEPIYFVGGGREIPVGIKKSLSFNDGQRKNSGWTLHEYELVSPSSSSSSSASSPASFQTQVLCHVKKQSHGQQTAAAASSSIQPKRHDVSCSPSKKTCLALFPCRGQRQDSIFAHPATSASARNLAAVVNLIPSPPKAFLSPTTGPGGGRASDPKRKNCEIIDLEELCESPDAAELLKALILSSSTTGLGLGGRKEIGFSSDPQGGADDDCTAAVAELEEMLKSDDALIDLVLETFHHSGSSKA